MMKKYFFAVVMCCITFSSWAQKQLVVLHTNDTHSCVMPLNPNLADTAIADRGGFLRRVNMVKQERQKNPDLLLFDSGDFSQGSPYYTLFKGDVEVGLMNEMGYDAATIGNHEFDFGTVSNGLVTIKFSAIVEAYNRLYDKYLDLCSACMIKKFCSVCIVSDLEGYKFCSEKNEVRSERVRKMVSFFEENAELYHEIMNVITIV